MKYSLPILIMLTIGCKTHILDQNNSFDYPTSIIQSDTNLFSYQLKEIESKHDAFKDSYNYLFYRPFKEPNLSIAPQPKETFRLTYIDVRQSVIITFNQDELIVKKGNVYQLYDTDTNKLTKLENFHLHLLERYFPIETATANPRQKKYLDSLVSLYPELLDVAYYHKLYDKYLVKKDRTFEFQKFNISITREQYNLIKAQIDSSGYWAFPPRIECVDPPMDGHSYTLEANTFTKYKTVRAIGCPGDKSNFPKICQKLIRLARLDKEITIDNNWDLMEVPEN